jgi:predicted sulfurtransferase
VLRWTQELVTLGPRAEGCSNPFTQTAPHLSPREFHSMLQAASQQQDKPTVLLDARNIYETAIGHFSVVSTAQNPTPAQNAVTAAGVSTAWW